MQGVWRWLVPLAVAAHAIGMIGGVYFVFTTKSWLLGTGMPARVLVALLWVVSGVLLLAAAWGFYTQTAWWPTTALVGAPLSFLGIVLWAGAIPPGTYVGAALDVAIVVYVLMVGK